MTELVKGNYKYIDKFEYKRLCVQLFLEEQKEKNKYENTNNKRSVQHRDTYSWWI